MSSASIFYNDSRVLIRNEKNRVYRQMANLLLGSESDLFSFNNTNYNELFFLSFKRRIFKDEIKKGNVNINLQVSGRHKRHFVFN